VSLGLLFFEQEKLLIGQIYLAVKWCLEAVVELVVLRPLYVRCDPPVGY